MSFFMVANYVSIGVQGIFFLKSKYKTQYCLSAPAN